MNGENFTLTKCNLANSCKSEDCDIIYPLTISDQVKINNETTLTDWINALNIPDEPQVTPIVTDGLPIATINDEDIKVSYLTKTNNVWNNGIPNFNKGYFDLDSNNKVIFGLDYHIDDFGTGNDITIGSIRNLNSDNISTIKIPKPLLSYSKDENSLTIKTLFGDTVVGSVDIPKSTIEDFCPEQKIYTLSNVQNSNEIKLVDNDGNESVATFQKLSASGGGISINDNNIEHTNSIAAGSCELSVTNNKKLSYKTINYDTNGHISSTSNKEIDIPKYVDRISIWESNSLSNHYFRIEASNITNASVNNPVYVPLLKITHESTNNFRVTQMFEIVSRLSFNYYGKYLLNFRNGDSYTNYAKDLLVIDSLSIANSASSYATVPLNIEAYYNAATTGNNANIIIYRKYISGIIGSIDEDTFTVEIIGQNNPNVVSPQSQLNSFEYYCMGMPSGIPLKDNEIEITSEDLTSSPSGTLLSVLTR